MIQSKKSASTLTLSLHPIERSSLTFVYIPDIQQQNKI